MFTLSGYAVDHRQAHLNPFSETSVPPSHRLREVCASKEVETWHLVAGVHLHTYDAEGLRRRWMTPSGTVSFVWDGQNVLLDEDSGAVEARYTDFPGTWGGLVSQRRGSQSRFFGFDGQQNARVLTDEGGNVTDSYVYTAFGEEKG